MNIFSNLLVKLHIISPSSDHKNDSPFKIIKLFFNTFVKLILFKYCYSSFILEPINFKKIRASFWRKMGIKVGKNVLIGHSVSIDYGNTDLITIEDNVIITNCCILLCHRRDMQFYHKGVDTFNLPYLKAPIHLKKGCQIGMGSIIMPGVTIGEGTIVGAGSVVTKNLPDWCIAGGCPAKVLKQYE